MAAGGDPDPPQPSPGPAITGVTAPECERMKERALQRNIFVKFMAEKLAEVRGKDLITSVYTLVGCPVTTDYFVVRTCAAAATGGFVAPEGVVLCHNHITRQTDVDTALRHELIHAYDYCRAGNLDFRDLENHACSEVRAASLSGDCSFWNEVQRGNVALQGQHMVCVRRRAALSVAMNENCPSKEAAEAAVDKVWDRCFPDTSPFDRRP